MIRWAMFLLLAVPALGQINRPVDPHKVNFGDYMTLLGIGVDHIMDGVTTYKGVTLKPVPCRERMLPDFIALHPGRLAIYEAATWAGQVWVTKRLIEHGHDKIARYGNYITLGFGSGVVFYNLHSIQIQEQNHPTRILIKE